MRKRYGKNKEQTVLRWVWDLPSGLCVFVISLSVYSLETKANLQNKIKVQPAPVSLNEKIQQESANPHPLIEAFNSTLFKSSGSESKKSSLNWFFRKDIREKRKKIKGSRKSVYESYWKIDMDGFLQEDDINLTAIMRTRLNAKVLAGFTKTFFARAEFELLTSTGSIQRIYQRLGDINGVSQREILFLWRVNEWLTLEFGSINQVFLQAPLLLADIPFPSVVGNIELFKEGKHDLSLSIQFASPNTFSTGNSIDLQALTDIPILFTKSLFWNYNSKSFYNVKAGGSFFYYTPLPNDIATVSKLYGNSVTGEPSSFEYNYKGFYFGVQPSFQLAPQLGLRLKTHYIVNISDMYDQKNLNKGQLFSLEVPFDITENIRVTPTFEYFIIQPDASVGYYNSERYGHSDRTGFVGELVFDFYDRNMSAGLRYHRSRAVRAGGSLKEDQNYYLVFLRTGYAKI